MSLLVLLPSSITAMRTVSAVFLVTLAAQENWVTCFWVFIIALVTDFLDGYTAKKFNVKTEFGANFDAFSDCATVVGGLVGLNIAGVLPVWFTVATLLPGFLIGQRWFFWPKDKIKSGLRMLLSVACLFMAWLALGCIYVTQAFGWSWAYLPIIVTILIALAYLKRHRIVAWWHS